jgi:hypothetical protein
MIITILVIKFPINILSTKILKKTIGGREIGTEDDFINL